MKTKITSGCPAGWLAAGVAGVLWFCACQPAAAAAADVRMPDGTNFVFWEQPLQFSKTYHVDNLATNADDSGPGTSERPFRTINRAAQVLQPGERVVIASGVYRECIRPARGGTGPDKMISYEAVPGAAVFVKASETLNDGWQPSSVYRGRGGDAGGITVWQHDLTGSLFPDAYNPFALGHHAGRLVVAGHKDRGHCAVSAPAGIDFRGRQTAGAGRAGARLGRCAGCHQPGAVVQRRTHPQPAEADHAGNRRRAGRQVLGGLRGNDALHARARRHRGTSADRNHHPRAGVCAAAERPGLHSHQGNYISARGQQFPAAAARPGFHPGR